MTGLDIMKAVSRPEWFKQPDQDLTFFAEHPCKDAWFNEWRGQTQGNLWQYDKHAAYLACASSVECGVGEYVHHVSISPRKQAGLWLVDISPFPDGGPLVLSGPQWIYTPLLSFYLEANISLVVREAYIWPEQHKVLNAFYRHLKAKREGGENVKALYTQGFGMLAHCVPRMWPGCIYRPDWYNLLKAELKARMYRHAWQVHQLEGIWPLAMKVDSLYYDRQVHSLRLGDGIGAFKEIRL